MPNPVSHIQRSFDGREQVQFSLEGRSTILTMPLHVAAKEYLQRFEKDLAAVPRDPIGAKTRGENGPLVKWMAAPEFPRAKLLRSVVAADIAIRYSSSLPPENTKFITGEAFGEALCAAFRVHGQNPPYLAQAQLLAFLACRGFLLHPAPLDAGSDTVRFVGQIAWVTHNALTNLSNRFDAYPVKSVFDELKMCQQCNPAIAQKIDWMMQRWLDLVASAEEIANKRSTEVVGKSDGDLVLPQRPIEIAAVESIALANAAAAAEMGTRALIVAESEYHPDTWSDPTAAIVAAVRVGNPQLIVIDDRRLVDSFDSALGATENLLRSRVELLDALGNNADARLWLFLDAYEQWGGVIRRAAENGARDVPDVVTVIKKLKALNRARFVPESSTELLRALNLPDVALSPLYSGVIEFWVGVVAAAERGGVRIGMYHPHSRDTVIGADGLEQCLGRHVTRNKQRAVVLGKMLSKNRWCRTSFRQLNLMHTTGLTFSRSDEKINPEGVFRYATQQEISASRVVTGRHKTVAIKTWDNEHFLNGLGRIFEIDPISVVKTCFSGDYDYVLISGGNSSEIRREQGTPGLFSRLGGPRSPVSHR